MLAVCWGGSFRQTPTCQPPIGQEKLSLASKAGLVNEKLQEMADEGIRSLANLQISVKETYMKSMSADDSKARIREAVDKANELKALMTRLKALSE